MYGMGRERLGAVLRLPGAESPTPERAAALASMGDFAWRQGALGETRACYEESLMLSRNAGDLRRISWALNGLGAVSLVENDSGVAYACFEEALRLARELGESGSIGHSLNCLAILAWERGDLVQAREHWEAALAEARASGRPSNVVVGVGNLTEIALRNGAWEQVRLNLLEMLPIVRDLRSRSLAATTLRRSSALAAAMNDVTRAARWCGSAVALEHAVGWKQHFHKESVTYETVVREKLGGPEFARALQKAPRSATTTRWRK